MAKRFLDTGFLQQKWIRKLKPEQKIFLIYLMLECDNAGLIDLDMDDAEFWIGKKIGSPIDFLPEGYLIPINNSGKYFQPKFIEWQYPNFPHSKVHQQKQAKDILIKNGLFDIENQLIMLPKDYLNFTQVLPNRQVNGNGNVNVDDNVNDIVMPFEDEKFTDAWDLWKRFKKQQFRFIYKSIGEQGALKDISDLSNGNMDLAIAIIHQSIKKGWQGLFEIKDEFKNVSKSSIDRFMQSYQETLNKL